MRTLGERAFAQRLAELARTEDDLDGVLSLRGDPVAQCVLCGKRGWLLVTAYGMCKACGPDVFEKATAQLAAIKEAEKAARRVKTLDSRVDYYGRMLAAFEPILEWEMKGVQLAPTNLETGVQTGTTWAKELDELRRSWDDDIVEEMEAEAKDAEQRASAALTPRKRARALEGMLERVRYFRQKMSAPSRLDAVEARLARAVFGAPYRFCSKPVPDSEQSCPACGASSSAPE
jgi:hypothetical protein